jgi:hypothetical protein
MIYDTKDYELALFINRKWGAKCQSMNWHAYHIIFLYTHASPANIWAYHSLIGSKCSNVGEKSEFELTTDIQHILNWIGIRQLCQRKWDWYMKTAFVAWNNLKWCHFMFQQRFTEMGICPTVLWHQTCTGLYCSQGLLRESFKVEQSKLLHCRKPDFWTVPKIISSLLLWDCSTTGLSDNFLD